MYGGLCLFVLGLALATGSEVRLVLALGACLVFNAKVGAGRGWWLAPEWGKRGREAGKEGGAAASAAVIGLCDRIVMHVYGRLAACLKTLGSGGRRRELRTAEGRGCNGGAGRGTAQLDIFGCDKE